MTKAGKKCSNYINSNFSMEAFLYHGDMGDINTLRKFSRGVNKLFRDIITFRNRLRVMRMDCLQIIVLI